MDISSNDNETVFCKFFDSIKNGVITPAENQVAATVFKNSESPLSWVELKIFISLNIHLFSKKNDRVYF